MHANKAEHTSKPKAISIKFFPSVTPATLLEAEAAAVAFS